VDEEGEGVDMRAIVSAALSALLLVPALCYAAGAQAASAFDMTPLVALALNPWTAVVAAVFLLLGGIVGVPIGTPIPTLEGVGIAGFIHWVPTILNQEHFPPVIQDAFVLFMLFWMVSYVVMFAFMVRSGFRTRWESFAFMELGFMLTRATK
jgi:hypothetical protein